MSNLLVLLLLTLAQFAMGFGILSLFRIQLKQGLMIPLAVLLGIAVCSLIPFLLQLCYIPLGPAGIFLSIAVACILLNLRVWQGIKKKGMAYFKNMPYQDRPWKLRLYDIPFLLLLALIIVASVWRCFYLPPLPRDVTSGSEAIAEYAVREHTMINSLFSVNLESTNNPFKPPFIISLQLIYKLAGFPFGQVWLSVVFISFILFLYEALCDSLHRLVAGWLLIFFLAIPEMYAYTFMILFDYSNTVFFFLAFYFLFTFLSNRQPGYAGFAGLLMGIATYIRSETLVLAALALPLIAWQLLKQKANVKMQLRTALSFLWPSVLLYVISIPVYINYYLPVKYHVPDLINTHLFNLAPLYKRWWAMNRELIFSKYGIELYGYFIFLFLLLLLAEIVVKRRFTAAGRNWLYAALVVYLGLPLLGWLLPLMDLDNTTKRGLFKLFPLLLLYLGNNSLLTGLSQKITKWETSRAIADQNQTAGT